MRSIFPKSVTIDQPNVQYREAQGQKGIGRESGKRRENGKSQGTGTVREREGEKRRKKGEISDKVGEGMRKGERRQSGERGV